MRIQMAHLRNQGINFAVFDADARSGMDNDRSELLWDLTRRARASGLAIDRAALAFRQGGRLCFFGTPDLVRYLSSVGGVPRWTHTINV